MAAGGEAAPDAGSAPDGVDRPDLKRFFAPNGVAVFGSIVDHPIVNGRYSQFGCPIHLINPKGGEHSRFPVYRDLDEVPGPIELAMIRTAPKTCAALLERCGRRNIPFALVFSAGFGEVGPEGRVFEDELARVARRYGVRVMGPNTNENSFERFPVPEGLRGGLIGLITQSGHNGRPVVQGSVIGAAFSRWIAGGNEVDLEAAHYLRFFAEDPATRVIAGYIEGFRDFERLRDSLQCASEHDKPVVMLKIGATAEGAATAVTHTGHMTGADAVIGGLFRQYGVSRVRDLDELCETANLFSKLPAGAGARVALYSVSGGSGTLMTEAAASFGLEIPRLAEATQQGLRRYIPDYLTVANPIDNGGAFVTFAPQADRLAVLDLIAADPNIDLIVVGITGAMGPLSDNFAEDLAVWAPTAAKPVVATWNSYKTDEPGFPRLAASGVPLFRSFRTCFGALRAYADRERWRAARRPRPAPRPPREIAALNTPGVVASQAAAELLRAEGVAVAGQALVASAEAARTACARFGGRTAMKLVSPAFPHKSDAGLVRLGVGEADASAAYDGLVARARALDPEAPIEGVLVQEQVAAGVEMIVGLLRDPTAGTAISLGAGGVYAEVLDDVAVRPLPIDAGDVREMLAELKVSALLAGVRGMPPADVAALVGLVLAVARLGEAAGPRLAELDLNPVIVTPDRAVAVDVLLVAR
jgi:acyl-CoA synthetase (NDP forming)